MQKALTEALQRYFTGWHLACIKCLSGMIIGLIKAETVNLTRVARNFPGAASVSSHYRRLQRFMAKIDFDQVQVARLVMHLFGGTGKVYLSMDRTNWCFGKANVNFLVLALVHDGIAIPLFWSLLDKKGNSDKEERQALISQFLDTFGHERIARLFGDREFIGKDWFIWLKVKKVPFVLRIKENMHIGCIPGKTKTGNQEIRSLKPGEQLVLKQERTIGHPKENLRLFVAAMRIDDDESLIVVTDQNPETAIDDYAKRWEIETLFGCLKSRGFNMEDTHLTKPERLSSLMAILTIALAWCLRIGEIKTQKKKSWSKNTVANPNPSFA